MSLYTPQQSLFFLGLLRFALLRLLSSITLFSRRYCAAGHTLLPMLTATKPAGPDGTPFERPTPQRDSKFEVEDSIESVREREYPQLAGKTYLDHAGATVRFWRQAPSVCPEPV